MKEHRHPISDTPISGVRLGIGALIKRTDFYDCSDGTWRRAPSHSDGVRIQPGCNTVFIRSKDLSLNANNLLGYLAVNDFLVAKPLGSHWKVIPSLRWKSDGRMDWRVVDQACVPELVDYGLIFPHPEDRDVYKVTEVGKSTL